MNLGFVVNDLLEEDPKYTTIGLAHRAERLGHEAWLMGVSDFTYDPTGSVCARARRTRKDCDTQEDYHAALIGPDAEEARIDLGQLDVLMLRHDPAAEGEGRAWARYSPILFGQLAARAGALVLNDPRSLAGALDKTYFQQFPDAVRPRTLITRSKDEIRAFIEEERGKVVMKPLQGSGGRSVFLVDPGQESSNLNQITEAISREGYVVAQEYLPKAAEGDVRLFVMNGQPLITEGRFAALRRKSASDDIRSNLSAGGKPSPVEVTEEMTTLVETIRPKLVKDGMFLVGLDIVGDKLMEVNVFSPGGLHTMNALYGVDFFVTVIEALERKAEARSHYRRSENIDLATL